MPLYQYQCNDCKEVSEELWTTFQEAEESEPKYLEEAQCQKCKSKSKIRLVSSPMVSFKGDGWSNKHIGRVGSSTGRHDSTGSLRDRAAQIREEAKNLTSKDLYPGL